MKKFLLGILVSGAALAAQGQYSIDWFTIDGGGGSSAGGGFTVSGTVGQPDAHLLSGGGFTVVGGFWSLAGAVQTVDAPRLTVACSGPNSVTISWSASSAGFVLQETPRLVFPDWAPVVATPVDTNGVKQVIIAPPVGVRFYRLMRQP